MTTQPEQVLENNLVSQLIGLGHKSVVIKTEDDLLSNLKTQLEKHNKTSFTASEFDRILIHLSKGNIFDKAKTLRDKYELIITKCKLIQVMGYIDVHSGRTC